jgi:hypothetical protein
MPGGHLSLLASYISLFWPGRHVVVPLFEREPPLEPPPTVPPDEVEPALDEAGALTVTSEAWLRLLRTGSQTL